MATAAKLMGAMNETEEEEEMELDIKSPEAQLKRKITFWLNCMSLKSLG